MNLPMVDVVINGQRVRALFDTGCSRTIIMRKYAGTYDGCCNLLSFDGKEVRGLGRSDVALEIMERKLWIRAAVVEQLLGTIEVVIGMDVISRLGKVVLKGQVVNLVPSDIAAAMTECVEETKLLQTIDDKDFTAQFEDGKWTVKWKWNNGKEPTLSGTVDCYEKSLHEETKREFDKEIRRWIDEGILVPWKEKVERGILPLIAVEQPTKNKVRPVLDYRELNQFIECHTGDEIADVCSDRLREWRRLEEEVKLVDLKSAYLQIRVSEELWKYQLVNYQGRTYCLTRLGFGLSSAPRIMSKILKEVLAAKVEIKEATSSYIDDIIVSTRKTDVKKVVEHLREYGLETKPVEEIEGASVLGLKIQRCPAGSLMFGRGNNIPEERENMTRRELYSMCGQLIGHYPVANWLRIACSYVKRRAEGERWDDSIGQQASKMMMEILQAVRQQDPVRGKWKVEKTEKGTVWCDASSIGLGVAVEIDGEIVEDAAWLRKQHDYHHINVAELEAALKGVNLAIKWGLTSIQIITDSATVQGWVKLVLSEEKRVKTKGAAEILIQRKLGVLRDLIDELDLTVTIKCVASQANKADVLTRVKKSWLESERSYSDDAAQVCCMAGAMTLREAHEAHHMGVDRTLFLARKIDPSVDREAVKRVVRQCVQCQSIDPAPVTHQGGGLGVADEWRRLAVDVTHYRHIPYLTIVDCGPGRFAIWRELRNETADCIVSQLEEIFYERGAVDEILMDNAASFRSEEMRTFLDKWGVSPCYRAAYRPSGNGIVERHHRTIKASAERGDINPIEAVFWYNMSPRNGQNDNSVPQKTLFTYEWRHPGNVAIQDNPEMNSRIEVGEEVWVKPPNARCTTKWKKGRVTQINSRNNVEINGMPRHVLDIRPVINEESEQVGDDESKSDACEEQEVRNEQQDEVTEEQQEDSNAAMRYPTRVRKEPTRYEETPRRSSVRKRAAPVHYGE